MNRLWALPQRRAAARVKIRRVAQSLPAVPHAARPQGPSFRFVSFRFSFRFDSCVDRFSVSQKRSYRGLHVFRSLCVSIESEISTSNPSIRSSQEAAHPSDDRIRVVYTVRSIVGGR